MEKRYQVFVSSTYEDLKEERSEVMKALLELDCIPTGMELFPAADENSWALIKQVIDACDYYVLIVGGRYGSLAYDGMGYTEKEFRYAVKINKPRIAFIPNDLDAIPAGKTEKTEKGKLALNNFLDYVRNQRVCKFWNNTDHLGAVLSRSITNLIKTRPAIGWIRANERTNEQLLVENRLRAKIEELEEKLVNARGASIDEDTMSWLNETISIKIYITIQKRETYQAPITETTHQKKHAIMWLDLFAFLAPYMLHPMPETELVTKLKNWLLQKDKRRLRKSGQTVLAQIDPECMSRIRTQFAVTNLTNIGSFVSPSGKVTKTTWLLAEKGSKLLEKIMVVGEVNQSSSSSAPDGSTEDDMEE